MTDGWQCELAGDGLTQSAGVGVNGS